jgi:hypothetical protein
VKSGPFFLANEMEGSIGPDVADLVSQLRANGDAQALRSMAEGAGGWPFVEALALELDAADVHAKLAQDLAGGGVATALERLRGVPPGAVRDSMLATVGQWAVEHEEFDGAVLVAKELTPAARDVALHELAIVLAAPRATERWTSVAAEAAAAIHSNAYRFEPALLLSARDHGESARRFTMMALEALRGFLEARSSLGWKHRVPGVERRLARAAAGSDMVSAGLAAICAEPADARASWLLALLDAVDV